MTTRALSVPAALLVIGCGGSARTSDSAAAASDTQPSAGASAATSGDTSTRGSSGATTAVTSAARSGGRSGAASRGADTPVSTSSVPSDTGSNKANAADSVRGIVAVVGTAMDSRVVVRPAGGGRAVTLVGPQARTVGRLSGADVWVSGNRDEHGQLRVSRFTVRTVDGSPALDGTLLARGARLVLATRDGAQHPIGNPPAPLRDHVGARVWITGPLGTGPITFGVIEERR